MALHARTVDPRDVTIEIDEPTFRVHFWLGDRACREFEVSGADVAEVLGWAAQQRHGDETVFVGLLTALPSDPGGLILTRLAGVDPTRHDGGGGTAATARGRGS